MGIISKYLDCAVLKVTINELNINKNNDLIQVIALKNTLAIGI